MFEPDSDPNATITSFVQSPDYQFLIELVTAASTLPQCDWGLVRRQRLYLPWQVLSPAANALTPFLVVQAKVSACDGQYRAALENALTIRRIARHIGDETFHMYVRATGTDACAFGLIRYVLGKMPPDAETLTWLETELAAGGELERPSRETLTKWLDWSVQCLQASPDVLAGWIRDFARTTKTEGLTPAQALERARLAWEEVFESVLEVLESEKSPQDKDRALYHLSREAEAKMLGGDAMLEIVESEESLEDKTRAFFQLALESGGNRMGDPMALFANLAGAVDLYSASAYTRARVRAVKAAIAVYHIKATTGQLPQTLPEGLPKDPYSGEDFKYQVTERGFILRCRAKFPRHDLLDRNELHPEPNQFEFQVTEAEEAN
jgi:hypothetical protein